MLIMDYGLKNYVTIVHKVLRYNIFNTILYIEYNIVYCVTCTVYSVTCSIVYYIT